MPTDEPAVPPNAPAQPIRPHDLKRPPKSGSIWSVIIAGGSRAGALRGYQHDLLAGRRDRTGRCPVIAGVFFLVAVMHYRHLGPLAAQHDPARSRRKKNASPKKSGGRSFSYVVSLSETDSESRRDSPALPRHLVGICRGSFAMPCSPRRGTVGVRRLRGRFLERNHLSIAPRQHEYPAKSCRAKPAVAGSGAAASDPSPLIDRRFSSD